jgi:hypothetical protein
VILNPDENQEEKDDVVISRPRIATVLAMLNYTFQTVPRDEILYQYIATAMSTLLESRDKINYMLEYSLLQMRSINEFPRIKNTERALEQL